MPSPTITPLAIPKGDITLAALLFSTGCSPAPTPGSKRPVLIVVHPGGGVKEQAASLYATKLCSISSNAAPTPPLIITYDASHQGESTGLPRYLESPDARTSDILAVVDYLLSPHSSLPDGVTVDPDRVGVLGICAGGGYAVAAAARDERIGSVMTVSMVNFGDLLRKGWDGTTPPVPDIQPGGTTPPAAAGGGAGEAVLEYVPASALLPESRHHIDMREAAEYYLTPRGQHPRAENKMLAQSIPLLMEWDAFRFAGYHEGPTPRLRRPVLMIFGEDAGSVWHSERLDRIVKAMGGDSRMIRLAGVRHMDLYDGELYVVTAVREILEFFSDIPFHHRIEIAVRIESAAALLSG